MLIALRREQLNLCRESLKYCTPFLRAMIFMAQLTQPKPYTDHSGETIRVYKICELTLHSPFSPPVLWK